MNKHIFNFISKCLISILITLLILILIKSNLNFKNNFYKYTYGTNISFAKFNELYKKYIGNQINLDNNSSTTTVFNEKISYSKIDEYKDGIRLDVEKNYVVPVQKSGIVVFIGEKEGYNNTVIIQRIDGIDEWYGNIGKVNVKLYDYVKQGTALGEADEVLYLVYKKDGNILDYKEYFK